jgi:hypothetical protein
VIISGSRDESDCFVGYLAALANLETAVDWSMWLFPPPPAIGFPARTVRHMHHIPVKFSLCEHETDSWF